jgi:hypothetical protein
MSRGYGEKSEVLSSYALPIPKYDQYECSIYATFFSSHVFSSQ